jgi:hypothetical protein
VVLRIGAIVTVVSLGWNDRDVAFRPVRKPASFTFGRSAVVVPGVPADGLPT